MKRKYNLCSVLRKRLLTVESEVLLCITYVELKEVEQIVIWELFTFTTKHNNILHLRTPYYSQLYHQITHHSKLVQSERRKWNIETSANSNPFNWDLCTVRGDTRRCSKDVWQKLDKRSRSTICSFLILLL